MTSAPDWPGDDGLPSLGGEGQLYPRTERDEARRRGCLSMIAMLLLVLFVVAVVVLFTGCSTTTSTSDPARLPSEPDPGASPSTHTRTPVTFPAEVDLVLGRAWADGGHGCGITGPAVDELAAALERDIAELPAGQWPRLVATMWVHERCAA